MKRWMGGARAMMAIGALLITFDARAQGGDQDGDQGGDTAQRAAQVAAATKTPAPTEPSTVEAQLLAWVATQVDDWGRPCHPSSLLRNGASYYVACGAAGLWTLAPQGGQYAVTHTRDVGRAAKAFVTDPQGYVFLRLSGKAPGDPDSLAPIPGLRVGPPSFHANGSPLASTLEQIEVRGRVAVIDGLGATVDLGTRHGLRKGDHIRFVQGERHVVGVVRSADQERSQVAVGLNESVRDGAGAVLSREPTTASMLAPPLPSHTWHMGATLRPVFGKDEGLIVDAFVGMRPLRHLGVDLYLAPAAFSFSRSLSRGSLRTYGMVTGEFRAFSASFGVGLERVRGFLLPLVVQRLVLGARDGLHLQLVMSSAAEEGELRLASFAPSIQVPIVRAASLLLGMYVGWDGPIYLETGVRALLAGNGNADSLFLRFTVGLATVSLSGRDSGAGLHLGLGCEYRL